MQIRAIGYDININGKGNFYGHPIKGYMVAPNGGLYFFDPNTKYGYKDFKGNTHYEFKKPIYSDLPSDYYQGNQRLNERKAVINPTMKFQNY